MSNQVDTSRSVKYWQCKSKLAACRATALEYGMTLKTIKEEELWREEYKTWAAFCSNEEQITVRYANYLISAQKVLSESNETNGNHGSQIKNERQARAIADVPKDQQEKVINEAKKSGKITAKSISSAKAKIIDVQSEEIVERLDDTGYPIPDHKVYLFERAPEVKGVLDHISSIRSTLRKAQDASDRLWQPVMVSIVMADLDALYNTLKTAMPFAVCPYCSGQTAENCLTCKGRGVVSKFMWDTAIPKELKDIRAKVSRKK